MKEQMEYCKNNKLLFVATSVCPRCNNRIKDNGTYHITGCEKCQYSFCE